MNKCCVGCGEVLQNINESEKGYAKNLDFEYCQRCFRNINYNETKELDLKYSNDDLLNKINKKSSLTLFLVDFLSLTKEVTETFKKIKTEKILVVNKCDIIPKSVKDEKIMNFICEEYKVLEKIVIVSSLKSKNLSQIKNIIEENKNVYITGYTNAGKSSLIKALVNRYCKVKSKITTSIMPNTTLDFIKVKFNETFFYDSPGFNYLDNITNNNIKIIKKANGKKEIKPITIQIKDNDIISIDDEWFINVSKKNSVTFYINNSFDIKKVYNYEMVNKEYLNVKDDTDLIIKGIGFINFKNACTIELSFPLKYIEKRDSIFK